MSLTLDGSTYDFSTSRQCEGETGWDPGPGILGCSACNTGQTSPPATEYKETIKD